MGLLKKDRLRNAVWNVVSERIYTYATEMASLIL